MSASRKEVIAAAAAEEEEEEQEQEQEEQEEEGAQVRAEVSALRPPASLKTEKGAKTASKAF